MSPSYSYYEQHPIIREIDKIGRSRIILDLTKIDQSRPSEGKDISRILALSVKVESELLKRLQIYGNVKKLGTLYLGGGVRKTSYEVAEDFRIQTRTSLSTEDQEYTLEISVPQSAGRKNDDLLALLNAIKQEIYETGRVSSKSTQR